MAQVYKENWMHAWGVWQKIPRVTSSSRIYISCSSFFTGGGKDLKVDISIFLKAKWPLDQQLGSSGVFADKNLWACCIQIAKIRLEKEPLKNLRSDHNKITSLPYEVPQVKNT